MFFSLLINILRMIFINYSIIGNWPNTYTFTKAVAENLISENKYNLPISIFRPSISKQNKKG